MSDIIHPIILCGGSGTRLWPLSRKAFPKQFSNFVETSDSLFEASIKRLQAQDFASPVIVTGSDFRFIVSEQMGRVGVKDGTILIEPSARNTAPAILAAALVKAKVSPEAVLLVAPSDHAISNSVAFQEAVRLGLPAAQAGQIVTFGIAPTAPETGYGWLELGQSDGQAAVPLTRFVEKPNLEKAEAMLSAGNFLWNSGIFMFRASTIIEAFKAYAPTMVEPVKAAIDHAQQDLNFLRLDAKYWNQCPAESIDYAVMERVSNLVVVPFRQGWNDLGSWSAVAQEIKDDENGVSIFGNVTAIDCENSLIRSEHESLEVVAIGVKDIVAVAMKDAVLIVDRNRAQEVKKAVEILNVKGARQAENFLHDHRPWGHYESLATGDRFQVKRIVVKPGATLSLQSHMHRAEHWIVVSGTARVTLDEEVRLVTENQSIYIPLGAKHRMENPGKVPMVLIEVQTGVYLGEDDIIRYEDVYARGQGAKG